MNHNTAQMAGTGAFRTWDLGLQPRANLSYLFGFFIDQVKSCEKNSVAVCKPTFATVPFEGWNNCDVYMKVFSLESLHVVGGHQGQRLVGCSGCCLGLSLAAGVSDSALPFVLCHVMGCRLYNYFSAVGCIWWPCEWLKDSNATGCGAVSEAAWWGLHAGQEYIRQKSRRKYT